MNKTQTRPYAPPRSGGTRGKKRILERYNALKLGWLHDSIHFILLSLALFVLFRYVIGFAIVGATPCCRIFATGNWSCTCAS